MINLLNLLPKPGARQNAAQGRHTAAQVANYLLQKHHAKYRDHATPQAIQKLVYFCHAWMLGIHGRPLLSRQADGWQYGPYFHKLYKAQIKVHGQIAFSIEKTPPAQFDSVEQDLVDQVFDKYSHLTGIQLSSLCNGPETPWHQAWTSRRNYQDRIRIPDAALQSHYGQIRQNYLSQTDTPNPAGQRPAIPDPAAG